MTVARELEKVMGARLIDNHAIINLATMATEHGSPEYLKLLSDLTNSLFATLAENASLKNLIFTNALAAELEEDVSRLECHRELAKARNEIFVPVLLTCDVEENKARLVSAGRAERQKLTKPHILEEIYGSYTPYHPKDSYGLVVDVTRRSPQETAALIKQHSDNLMSVQIAAPSHRQQL